LRLIGERFDTVPNEDAYQKMMFVYVNKSIVKICE